MAIVCHFWLLVVAVGGGSERFGRSGWCGGGLAAGFGRHGCELVGGS
jgi:hypothetical protein